MRLRLIVVSGLAAVLASSIMYLIDYLIFRDSQQLLIQLVDDLSFIPISVFIVVVVIERLLTHQEKLLIRHKLNMVVGVFFSEVGNSLIRKLFYAYEKNEDIVKNFSISNLHWAIFHLTEELESRPSVSNLSGPDLDHIEGDIGRLYGQLLYQWLTYVEHLKKQVSLPVFPYRQDEPFLR